MSTSIIEKIPLYIESKVQNYQSKNFSRTKMGKELKKYKNKHIGERCFILGNGPSLTPEDLTTLHENGEITFATNRIYNIFDKTEWRPTYYCCEDELIIKEKQEEIENIPCEAKFIPINLKWYHEVSIKDANYFYINYNRDSHDKYSFSTDISKQINCRGTVTFTCMQIAAYMGFSEIYLLGVDHNYQKIIDDNGNIVEDKSVNDYFCEKYDEDIKDVVVHDMGNNTRAYIDAKAYCDESKKTTIYNSTRGGKLEVFQRVNFDELFLNKDYNEDKSISNGC